MGELRRQDHGYDLKSEFTHCMRRWLGSADQVPPEKAEIPRRSWAKVLSFTLSHPTPFFFTLFHVLTDITLLNLVWHHGLHQQHFRRPHYSSDQPSLLTIWRLHRTQSADPLCSQPDRQRQEFVGFTVAMRTHSGGELYSPGVDKNEP